MKPRPASLEVWEEPTFDGEPEWYWRLTAQNGKILCDSEHGYSHRWAAIRAARGVQRALRTAKVREG